MEPASPESAGGPAIHVSTLERTLRRFTCPSCGKDYSVLGDEYYMCARDHGDTTLGNGLRRHVVIQEWAQREEHPWEIPDLVEEREAHKMDWVEDTLFRCIHPDDKEYGDVSKHLFGVSHLTREMVREKYSEYVLRPYGVLPSVQEWPPSQEDAKVASSLNLGSMTDHRKKLLIVATAVAVSLVVVAVAVLRLLL